MAWWDSAFLQTVTGAVAGISGAFVGAWWTGKKAAQTASDDRAAHAAEAAQDRLQAAEVASMDRLHQNRTELIARLSECLSHCTTLFVTLDRLNREMRAATANGNLELFQALLKESVLTYSGQADRLSARLIDLTLESALYLEPSSADAVDSSRLKVNRSHRAILRNQQGRADAGDETHSMPEETILKISQDRAEYIHNAGLHFTLLMVHLGKQLNPRMNEWLDRQLAMVNSADL